MYSSQLGMIPDNAECYAYGNVFVQITLCTYIEHVRKTNRWHPAEDWRSLWAVLSGVAGFNTSSSPQPTIFCQPARQEGFYSSYVIVLGDKVSWREVISLSLWGSEQRNEQSSEQIDVDLFHCQVSLTVKRETKKRHRAIIQTNPKTFWIKIGSRFRQGTRKVE